MKKPRGKYQDGKRVAKVGDPVFGFAPVPGFFSGVVRNISLTGLLIIERDSPSSPWPAEVYALPANCRHCKDVIKKTSSN